mmetsp:Transcript_4965/g.7511  ORF Transcript_4965/g.7511 Transcript_4965/m.7511 type:complete len:1186 (+) Transcript_4965:73-3630(+)|eukprot:CAMPEP_0201545512 /NCGR_PEP_ID=MMETSP0173_2-20130828/2008_1 /ASSEMBLY_ACC=CAM_ASM_000268 /TAXON_ID=218659 /ORGANISM="Vexillifera sp., Strain DIVA3 564/2" /LENGTH=1185 /DNA_ID=CAMNT_0047953927 /DNA_START=7 /DNA_END=3564 /DNA_ORIENTATION=-
MSDDSSSSSSDDERFNTLLNESRQSLVQFTSGDGGGGGEQPTSKQQQQQQQLDETEEGQLSSSEDDTSAAATARRGLDVSSSESDSDDDYSSDSNALQSLSTTDAYGRQRAKKRARYASTGGARFIDDIADVSEEDDDGLDDDDALDDLDVDAIDDARMGRQDVAEYRRSIFEREVGDLGAQERDALARFEERSRQSSSISYGADIGVHEVSEHELLPDITSPKLWMVKCKEGKERSVVVQLMHRQLTKSVSSKAPPIFSAVAPTGLNGFIYVEANKQSHVRDALKGLEATVNVYKIKLVPISEMTSCLRVPKRNTSLPNGTWVRVKRGLYRGDIGQVVSYDETRALVMVRLIPRLDIDKIAGIDNDDQQPIIDTAESQQDPAARGVKRTAGGRKKRARPAPAFFDIEEVQNLRLKIANGGNGTTIFRNQHFKNGFLHKQMALKSLETTGVIPPPHIVQQFATDSDAQLYGDNELDDDDDDTYGSSSSTGGTKKAAVNAILASLQPKRKVVFQKGDSVRVVKGDLKGLHGIVHNVVDDNTVEVEPKDTDINQLIPLESGDLEKYFNVGDHVKVVAGRHEGETGLVIRVEGSIAIVFSDLSKKEMKVLTSHIQECTEVSSGQIRLGDYELHDLVQLTPQLVGIITKVDHDSFKVLDNNGELRTVKLTEIGRKRRSRNTTAFDKYQNPINQGNEVKVLEGKYSGRRGIVKHLYRHIAFLQSKSLLENGGVFVVRTSTCSVLGGNKSGGAFNPMLARSSAAGLPPGIVPMSPGSAMRAGQGASATRGMSMARSRHRRQNDELYHAIVRVTRGAWKGYLGTVVDCSEQIVRVQLQSNHKTVSVERNHVTQDIHSHSREGTAHSVAGGAHHWGQAGAMPSTPMHIGTPSRQNAPSTPSRGSETPSHDSVWDPSAIGTPGTAAPATGWDWNQGNTPGAQTPGTQTPGMPTPLSSATPGTAPMQAYGTPGVQTPQIAQTPQAASTPYAPFGTPNQPFTPGVANTSQPTPSYTPLSASTPSDQFLPNTAQYQHTTTPGIQTPGQTPLTGVSTPTGVQQDAYVPSGFQPATPGGGVGVGWLEPGLRINVLSALTQRTDKVEAVVRSIDMDGTAQVYTSDGQTLAIAPNAQRFTEPGSVTSGSHVKILDGEQKGKIVKVTSVDPTSNECVIETSTGVELLSLESIAPLDESFMNK